MAINQSSLVFDGRLVIDEHGRTNDPLIYGAGPLTKFQRGYHHDDLTHASFNSKEVGKQVCPYLADLICERRLFIRLDR
ncbi:MAG: hypothetical protein HC794_07620 [Nitrospiraceae bacterium]|nr:hypothetical protein [Nitrospiraceae bacterium]